MHNRQSKKSNKLVLCLTIFFLLLMSISVTHAETYNFVMKWGSYSSDQHDSVRNVAVDSSGNVYVADTANDRIQKFDSNGNFITKWGSYGNGTANFIIHVELL